MVGCVWAYANLCLLYRVMRHFTSTYGQSITNGASYKWGKLHHSPWHSDIWTSNQLNTPPRWLTYPFHTQQQSKEKRSQSNIMHLLETNLLNKFTFRRHSRCHFQFQYHSCEHFRVYRGHFRRHAWFRSRDHFRDHSQVQSRSSPSRHTISRRRASAVALWSSQQSSQQSICGSSRSLHL